MIVALLMMLVLLGAITVYMARQVHDGIAGVFPRVKRWPVVTATAVLNATVLLAFWRSMLPLPDGVERVIGVVGAYWMGCFVYLFLFLAMAQLVFVIVKRLSTFGKKPIWKTVTVAAAVVCALSTAGYGFYHAADITHVSYTVTVEGKTDISDMNIVMISDLHLGAVGSEARLDDIVAEINALEPDVVLVAGDVFDTDFSSVRDPERASKTLRSLRSTYGVFACPGNHDGGETHEQMRRFLEQSAVTLLDDDYAVVDGRLVVVGRRDASPIGGYGGRERQELSAFFDVTDPSLPVIVMDHTPTHIETYTDAVDLIVSGHTHKGQIFPGNLITDMIYTVDHGYYREHATAPQVIVTSGVGTWGMPMRVGSDSEIVSIRIVGGAEG